MKEIIADENLVACCGLYCGACKRYLREKCSGCGKNERATWCKVRNCCRDKGYLSCAECAEHSDPRDCKLFNNAVARIFALIFRSNRAACIEQIRAVGVRGHAEKMAAQKLQSLKRN